MFFQYCIFFLTIIFADLSEDLKSKLDIIQTQIQEVQAAINNKSTTQITETDIDYRWIYRVLQNTYNAIIEVKDVVVNNFDIQIKLVAEMQKMLIIIILCYILGRCTHILIKNVFSSNQNFKLLDLSLSSIYIVYLYIFFAVTSSDTKSAEYWVILSTVTIYYSTALCLYFIQIIFDFFNQQSTFQNVQTPLLIWSSLISLVLNTRHAIPSWLSVGNITPEFKADFHYFSNMLASILFLLAIIHLRHKILSQNNKSSSILVYLIKQWAIPAIMLVISIVYSSDEELEYRAIRLSLTPLIWPVTSNILSRIHMYFIRLIHAYPISLRKHLWMIYEMVKTILPFLSIGIPTFIMSLIWKVNIFIIAQEILGPIFVRKFILISFIIFNSYIVSQIINLTFEARLVSSNNQDKQRTQTLFIISSTLTYIAMGAFAFLTSLSIIGIDASSIFQSLGLLSAGLSFSAQQFIRDILNGILIVLDDTIKIGDWLEIDSRVAIVEEVKLRYMRVRWDDGTLLTIPFHKIDVVYNKSRKFACVIINISVDRESDTDQVNMLIETAFTELRQIPEFKQKIFLPLEIRGISEFTGFSIILQAKIKVAPHYHTRARRAFNKILKKLFDENNIKIPNPSILVDTQTIPSSQTKTHTSITDF